MENARIALETDSPHINCHLLNRRRPNRNRFYRFPYFDRNTIDRCAILHIHTRTNPTRKRTHIKHTHTAAYKHADGKKIDGKRVLVDVERARTVKGWLPRRLGK